MKLHTKQLTLAYAVLSYFGSIFGITYGPIQCRFSEALCVLPFFLPETAWGLGVGCLIANLLSPYGVLDIVVGSAATLLAAVATRLLGKIRFGGLPWLSALPPILFNAVAIGGEWCYAMTGSINGAFWVFAGQIALGQLPPCLLGVWLIHLLERRGLQNIIEGK